MHKHYYYLHVLDEFQMKVEIHNKRVPVFRSMKIRDSQEYTPFDAMILLLIASSSPKRVLTTVSHVKEPIFVLVLLIDRRHHCSCNHHIKSSENNFNK